MGYRVAVVGATGNVGREILNILAERQFPLDEIAAVASPRSTGDVVDFGDNGEELRGQEPRAFRFCGLGHRLVRGGLRSVEDLCAQGRRGRLHGDRQQLAVPDGPGRSADRAGGEPGGDRRLSQEEHHRQPELLDRAAGGRAEAAARCGEDQAGRGRDLSVGLGRRQSAAMDELFEQSRNIFVGDSNEPQFYPKQIAFNVIPHIGDFLDDGSTKEEWKMVVETKKILDPAIKVTATCVRVPVFVGHSEAVNIEFENEISADEARDILREAPGVMVVDKREDGGYVTPVEASAIMRPTSAASARIRRSRTASACGSSATICARARR